jgi:DNA-binding MarR family transcriptional regulator
MRTISDSRTIADEIIDQLTPLITGERSAFAAHCHERAISMAHLHLMTLLDRHGPQAMGRVADLLGVGLPTATGLVSRMEDRGLVCRVREAGDRRIVLVELSDEGRAELSAVQAGRRRRMAEALHKLNGEQQHALLESIQNLRQALTGLDQAQEGAPTP